MDEAELERAFDEAIDLTFELIAVLEEIREHPARAAEIAAEALSELT